MSDALKSQILTLFGTFSWIVGIALCGYAVYKIYKYSDDGTNESFMSIATTFCLGVVFVQLNGFIAALNATFNVKKIGISYTTGDGGSKIAAAALAGFDNLSFIIGIGFLLGGLFTLVHATNSLQRWAGGFTIFVSVLIANFGWFVATVVATLGGK